MHRVIGLALFVVGIVLLAMGVSASDSIASEISRFFTGHPSDRSIWLILGGLVSTILGAAGLMASRNHSNRA
jgi:Ca2+/Na+ antiporter